MAEKQLKEGEKKNAIFDVWHRVMEWNAFHGYDLTAAGSARLCLLEQE